MGQFSLLPVPSKKWEQDDHDPILSSTTDRVILQQFCRCCLQYLPIWITKHLLQSLSKFLFQSHDHLARLSAFRVLCRCPADLPTLAWRRTEECIKMCLKKHPRPPFFAQRIAAVWKGIFFPSYEVLIWRVFANTEVILHPLSRMIGVGSSNKM